MGCDQNAFYFYSTIPLIFFSWFKYNWHTTNCKCLNQSLTNYDVCTHPFNHQCSQDHEHSNYPHNFPPHIHLTGLEMEVCAQVYPRVLSGTTPVWGWGQQDWREGRAGIELWCRDDRGPSPVNHTWSLSELPLIETMEPALYTPLLPVTG